MSMNDARRQKKLMKKRQKDKLRKKKQESLIITPRKKIITARKLPFYECLINQDWRDSGLATIVISRQQPNGNLTFGVFLVDIFCQGLKDTFCNCDFSIGKYKTELVDKSYSQQKSMKCPVSLAHHVIYDGIAYAAQFGFRPNEDFKLSRFILDAKADVEPCEDIEFGRDGKPLFISGPHDNANRIIQQLTLTAGNGNFDYIAQAMP